MAGRILGAVAAGLGAGGLGRAAGIVGAVGQAIGAGGPGAVGGAGGAGNNNSGNAGNAGGAGNVGIRDILGAALEGSGLGDVINNIKDAIANAGGNIRNAIQQALNN